MGLGAGQSGATLEILHIVRRVTPYLRRTSGLAPCNGFKEPAIGRENGVVYLQAYRESAAVTNWVGWSSCTASGGARSSEIGYAGRNSGTPGRPRRTQLGGGIEKEARKRRRFVQKKATGDWDESIIRGRFFSQSLTQFIVGL
jgi:hypothetical protein